MTERRTQITSVQVFSLEIINCLEGFKSYSLSIKDTRGRKSATPSIQEITGCFILKINARFRLSKDSFIKQSLLNVKLFKVCSFFNAAVMKHKMKV